MVVRRRPDAVGDTLHFSRARPEDAGECVRLRGLTRENAISEERLREYGVTVQSWAADIESGALPGWVARSACRIVGYGFGAAKTGEVVVLALHPAHEGQGLGSRLLRLVVQDLRSHGHQRLFLGCSPDPRVRSYGFYRHLGWSSTGAFDAHGDEVLELTGGWPNAGVDPESGEYDLAADDKSERSGVLR